MEILREINAKFSFIEKIAIALGSIGFMVFNYAYFTASADPAYQLKTRAERQYRDYVRANLKDPSSVKFVQTNFRLDGYGGIRVSGCYMAKNSFGAYNGYHHAQIEVDKQGKIKQTYMDMDYGHCDD